MKLIKIALFCCLSFLPLTFFAQNISSSNYQIVGKWHLKLGWVTKNNKRITIYNHKQIFINKFMEDGSFSSLSMGKRDTVRASGKWKFLDGEKMLKLYNLKIIGTRVKFDGLDEIHPILKLTKDSLILGHLALLIEDTSSINLFVKEK